MAHMSPAYFCRFFKATTGDTATEYILRLRVDMSADLLANSAKSVTDIAYAVGFSSHSYYDRVFKRLMGMTPLEYRRQIPA
jgi:AraC-like DNA-binding protein